MSTTIKYQNKVYVSPKHWDDKATPQHLQKVGVELGTLRTDQVDYIGVKMEGQIKLEHYRY